MSLEHLFPLRAVSFISLDQKAALASDSKMARRTRKTDHFSSVDGPVVARTSLVTLALAVMVQTGCSDAQVLGRQIDTERPDTESPDVENAGSCELADYHLTNEPEQETLLVATFWNNDQERAAMGKLMEGVHSYYLTASKERPDREAQQLSLKEVFESEGQLPNVFQANAGSDVFQWVVPGDPERSQLCPLQALNERYGWDERYFESALAPASCGGVLYALPIGVHRLNMLFFNQLVFERLQTEGADQGIELMHPEDLSNVQDFIQLLEDLAALQDADGGPIPLAVGNQSAWPLTIMAFENFLVSQGNGAYEELFMMASDEAGNEKVRASLEHLLADLRAVAPFSNLEQHMKWEDAVGLVAAGDAVFTVMGDWAWAQVWDHMDEAARENVVATAFPGTEGTFVYTPDTFAVPRRSDTDGSPAHYWLRQIVDDTETQRAFHEIKHSIPARKDISEDDIAQLPSKYSRDTYREFTACQDPVGECQLLLAVSGLAPPPGPDPCFDEAGILLAHAIGTHPMDPNAEEDEEPQTRQCDEPLPQNPTEAGERFIELMLEVSSTRFAAACR